MSKRGVSRSITNLAQTQCLIGQTTDILRAMLLRMVAEAPCTEHERHDLWFTPLEKDDKAA